VCFENRGKVLAREIVENLNQQTHGFEPTLEFGRVVLVCVDLLICDLDMESQLRKRVTNATGMTYAQHANKWFSKDAQDMVDLFVEVVGLE
jgi:hypothetical protein